jgi:YYY domain-containing protein
LEKYSAILIGQWLLSLWLLGWIALPYGRRIFSRLPDGGLAAGRVLFLVLFTLLAFWLAAFHLLALTWAPLLACGLLLLMAVATALSPRSAKYELSQWLRVRRRALLISDLIFIGAFLFFVSMRLCRPEINDMEKPMDCAIIGTLSRTDYLPAKNPWFAGAAFTNYYYFGHLMGALLKRIFITPLPYAYNLIQPTFCAFFISVLWSLCAALCGSLRRGAISVLLVALCGNFEPLRQFYAAVSRQGWSGLSPNVLDWWSTSRVIPDTINEYPFFTLAIGDAHAHFFALSILTLILCTCHALAGCAVEVEQIENIEPEQGRKWVSAISAHGRRRLLLLFLAGCELGALLMTNTWDAPLYGLLVLTSAWLSSQRRETVFNEYSRVQRIKACGWACAPVALAIIMSWPFFRSYHPPIGGFKFEFWQVPASQFFLVSGGFLGLWALATAFWANTFNASCSSNKLSAKWTWLLLTLGFFLLFLSCFVNALLPLGLFFVGLDVGMRFCRLLKGQDSSPRRSEMVFLHCLAGLSLIALLCPFFFYLQGFFGGPLRHQDTIFKFGLQSWMLLGVAATCAVMRALSSFCAVTSGRRRLMSWALVLIFLAWIIPLSGSWIVWRQRTVSVGYSRFFSSSFGTDASSNERFSLNGARQCSRAEQGAIFWLESREWKNAFLVEAVGRDDHCVFIAAYSGLGRISALSGLPAYIGWPQHAGFWGAEYSSIQDRLRNTEKLYQFHDSSSVRQVTHEIARQTSTLAHANLDVLLYVGDLEEKNYRIHASSYFTAGYRPLLYDKDHRAAILTMPK